ncbi:MULTISPECIES: lipase/acyltransferase domain-containing protein [Enterobacterales]|uniref:lipase/acyltransferase domain-containing protein n=1 Tax=Enterobacterales TaxID=91347 RepID=UPI000847F10D|nr:MULTISPECIES: hypothetical protein [Enterobacterales]WOO51530.1 hypothetical protein R2S03_10335 [Hafnia alvei]ODQ04584.1 hypothetical protein BGK50_05885 [Shigella sp. FC130]OEI92117.1 hypothetical protein BHE86_07375 [Shigella sp. FC1655]OEJ07954.1 hypothetical protein BHE89_03460 [Shigella sp. FC1967]WPF06003.1 hypothetical protein SB028_09185 [Proteus vulgaris]
MPLNRGWSLIRAQLIAAQIRQAKLDDKIPNLPIIYLPGILGTKLFDRQKQAFIWGDHRSVFTKSDYEYEYPSTQHSPRVLATEQLHAFSIVPYLVSTLVTQELKDVLETALGYREGQDLFFLAHDWRADHRVLVDTIDREVDRLKTIFGENQPFIFIAQSASNLAIRYWLRHTTPENRALVAKWYAFGPPWHGTFQALSMMETGYYAGSRYLYGFSPDDVCGCPFVYQLLPPNPVVIDSYGRALNDFDIYDEACWEHYRLGPYKTSISSAQNQRVREALAKNLQGAKRFTDAVSGINADEQAVPQVWYLSDNNITLKAAIYGRDRWYLQAKEIKREFPQLVAQTLTVGDDHLPLEGLLQHWSAPIVRDRYQHPWGNSFAFISQASTHRALINHTPNLRSLAFDIATERRKIHK